MTILYYLLVCLSVVMLVLLIAAISSLPNAEALAVSRVPGLWRGTARPPYRASGLVQRSLPADGEQRVMTGSRRTVRRHLFSRPIRTRCDGGLLAARRKRKA